MNSWINLNALWKIVVVGLLTGAGLPALFAIGLRLLSPPAPSGGAAAGRSAAGPVGYALAGLCFAVVLAAIGWGISVIVNHS
ncbi:hypothetical protein OG500_03640 [Kitasatospora sp. NBC_01250]|uniref:hypothetical protein n=1 Tax=unclassified Kitasatospora TaxID=2633591 RepID=UPI002E154B5D|nr:MULTISPECIES: hypothetical protein [unclassified Kitasatospora]WSJ65245.1 hypothetical protein OG294_03570 [Kitasatospora sp. NBC_01302]